MSRKTKKAGMGASALKGAVCTILAWRGGCRRIRNSKSSSVSEQL